MEDMARSHEWDAKFLKIEEQRFDLEKRWEDRQVREATESPDIQKWRLELDEKNEAVGMEERKQSIEDRKGLMDVLGALVGRLK